MQPLHLDVDAITATCLSLLGIALLANAGLLVLLAGLRRVFASAPCLVQDPPTPRDADATSLTVVIPAFNEEDNIVRSLSSVLRSEPPADHWHVIVIDDDSSDATAAIAESITQAYATDCTAEVSVLAAGARPQGERWVGKNWACSRAMEQVTSAWVLFLDADVSLAPSTLRRALHQAVHEQADLFSLAPRLVCSCLAEWMVQPIMASLLGLGFPIAAANDPASDIAFAAGPFMLFRTDSYAAIGGHRAMAGEVVEDLALAQRIKRSGYRLRYCLGLDAVDLQMYSDLASLWEGWSKNWFLGLERSVVKALGAGGVVLLMFSGPWLTTAAALVLTALLVPVNQGAPGLLIAAIALGLTGVGLQLALRLWIRARFSLPMQHWWLMGAGGLIVAAIAPVSVWRSLTGFGWTWKGRSLASR